MKYLPLIIIKTPWICKKIGTSKKLFLRRILLKSTKKTAWQFANHQAL